jgi:hypothetical protein
MPSSMLSSHLPISWTCILPIFISLPLIIQLSYIYRFARSPKDITNKDDKGFLLNISVPRPNRSRRDDALFVHLRKTSDTSVYILLFSPGSSLSLYTELKTDLGEQHTCIALYRAKDRSRSSLALQSSGYSHSRPKTSIRDSTHVVETRRFSTILCQTWETRV